MAGQDGMQAQNGMTKGLQMMRDLSSRSLLVVEEATAATIHHLETQQRNIVSYGFCMSFCSPTFNLYQVCKLYKVWPASFFAGAKMIAAVYPAQVMLRVAQINMATVCRDNLDTWSGFAALGVLQGGVYGHATMDFAHRLGVGSGGMDMTKIFRGSGFAAVRDLISQGLPFAFSGTLQDQLDKVAPAWVPREVDHWAAVGFESIIATYLSHPLHILATSMQANQKLTYRTVLPSVYRMHGMSFMWKGVHGRMALMMSTNVFNEKFLKPVWQGKVHHV